MHHWSTKEAGRNSLPVCNHGAMPFGYCTLRDLGTVAVAVAFDVRAATVAVAVEVAVAFEVAVAVAFEVAVKSR